MMCAAVLANAKAWQQCSACCAYLQDDPHDDFQHLLQDLSNAGQELPENTDLIWGSSEELEGTHAGSSSSDSVLQSESPIISKVGWHGSDW